MSVQTLPVSPVIGCIRVAGDASHPAYIQLKNTNGSKNLYVYELKATIGADPIAGVPIIRMKRTASPVDLGGSGGLKSAAARRLNQLDATAINGLLRGAPDVGSIIAESAAHWSGQPAWSGQAKWDPVTVRERRAFPLVVAPLSALEFSFDTNGADKTMRIYGVWDEAANNQAGVDSAITPVSPIYAEVLTPGSTNGGPIVQLENPLGSGVNLRVYELGLAGGGSDQPSAGAMNSMVRTTTPFTLGGGGTQKIANAFRLDETDATAIAGVLRGMNFTNNGIGDTLAAMGDETKAQWLGLPSRESTDHRTPHWDRMPGGFPWTVVPGSALALAYLVQGSGTDMRGYACWDEIAA